LVKAHSKNNDSTFNVFFCQLTFLTHFWQVIQFLPSSRFDVINTQMLHYNMSTLKWIIIIFTSYTVFNKNKIYSFGKCYFDGGML